MAYNTFTVTQVTYNLTATITTPLELTLADNPTNVVVTQQTATVNVVNTIQPVTVQGSGGGGGTSYNQSLNTTDNVSFATLTVPTIFGVGQEPVSFPTGINAANFGTTFSGTLDFGSVFGGTVTNLLSLVFAVIPVDMGTLAMQPAFSLDMGSI